MSDRMRARELVGRRGQVAPIGGGDGLRGQIALVVFFLAFIAFFVVSKTRGEAPPAEPANAAAASGSGQESTD